VLIPKVKILQKAIAIKRIFGFSLFHLMKAYANWIEVAKDTKRHVIKAATSTTIQGAVLGGGYGGVPITVAMALLAKNAIRIFFLEGIAKLNT